MAIDISEYLWKEGPKLSSDIVQHLRGLGLSHSAARQRLKRRPSSVKTLSGLSFPNNARLYFHQSHFGTEKYWDGLYKALTKGSPAYGLAIAAMKAKDGIVLRDFFPIISGAPLKQQKKIGSDTVLARLKSIGFLTEITDDETSYVAFDQQTNLPVDKDGHDARFTTERVLLDTVADWARKLGMASYNKVSIRDRGRDLPKFGTHAFDLVAPSYLAPMVRYVDGKPKPGFLVVDIYLGKLCEDAAQAFLQKCESSRAMRQMPPFLPIVIANEFNKKAFDNLRANGVIPATPSALFGSNVARGLTGLLDTLRNASEYAVKKPDVIETLFSQLGHIEGAAANLRGALFELIVGHIVSCQLNGTVEIRKKPPKLHEIDVFGASRKTVRLIECKGHAPTYQVDAKELEPWIRSKGGSLCKYFRTQEPFKKCEFSVEFWTSGDFTEEALQLAKAVSNETARYSIKLVARQEIRELILKESGKGLRDVFDEQYTKHPITKMAQGGA